VGHDSSDGKTLTQRYKEAGFIKVGDIVGESIAYNSKTAKEVLM